METTRVFLAWSRQVESGEALDKALRIVKDHLHERGHSVYDWNEQHHIRNIGSEIEDQLRKADLVILEGTANNANLAFEVGFARCLDLPIIILKQEDSSELPEDFGAPKYLRYPRDADKEPQFKRFKEQLQGLLDTLSAAGLSSGHRELRRARTEFSRSIQQMIDSHSDDHAHLHLMNGWVSALSRDIERGGTSVIQADADYYPYMFEALQKRENITVRAIADLTDNTEPFWKSGNPELMSTAIGERIFLVDWRLFFEHEQELAEQVEKWKSELLRHQDYKIYIAAKNDIDPGLRHPFGDDAIGLHLLLIEENNAFGGYRRRQDYHDRRQFSVEKDQHRYQSAEAFYNAVRETAVQLEPTHDLVDLKRAWLTKNRIGYWSPDWTQQTERRPAIYFDRYDQHIRCWIPSYNELISECARTVAREILRIRQGADRLINLLELGYGTGSLTAQVAPWIDYLSQPFDGDLPPVGHYHAVDRAGQMRSITVRKLGKEATPWVRLLKQLAWQEVGVDVKYDVIFGSLVTHFMIDRKTSESPDMFFAECSKRLREGGSLIFADSFGPDDAGELEQSIRQWRGWMVNNGLSEEYADSFIEGNPDMKDAFSSSQLEQAATRHGFVKSGERPIYATPMFKIIVFRKPHNQPSVTAETPVTNASADARAAAETDSPGGRKSG